MATADIVIKTEPIDEDYPVIKQEELIIKPEPEDESLQNPQSLETELQTSFDLLIPKDEPVDDDYLNENTPPVKDSEPKEDPPASSANLIQCDGCNGYFVGARGLSTHRRLRCRNNHVCSVCGQVFLTFLILQEHMRRHKNKSSPSGKETKTTPPSRRSQPKVAKTSPPASEGVLFACNTCELTFRNGQSLMNHNRIHEGLKHICNQCGKSFKYAVHLKKHKKGDTCVREAIADVLRDNGSDINIKEEVQSEESEHENLTDQLLVGSTIISKADSVVKQEAIADAQSSSFEIKKEEFITDDIIPGVLIKQEPMEENSNDAQGFDDLILHELIDRKAKSIAKERKAIKRSLPPVGKKYLKQIKDEKPLRKKQLSLGNTDFEEVISSSTLSVGITTPEIDVHTFKSEFQKTEPAFLDESSQAESHQADDFEEMIASNTLPNFHNKSEVIQSLKEEYLKAKKKKPGDISTDESSQHSSSVVTDAIAPSSVYFSLTGDPEPYNEVVRKLDKNYRYTWICPSCPRRYVQRHAFLKHLTSSHYSERKEFDNVLFELRPELFYPTTSEDTYCHLCRVTLADPSSLRKHRNEFHKEDHTTKVQFKCDKCGKYCSTRSTLVDHVRANCGTEPQYGCAVCGKKFYTKSTLNLHRTMHTGELPHECRFCEKRFRTRGQLTVHTRTHTGERPFPCKVCEKRFTHRETLIAHLSRHIDMKRYKCYGCQQFFSCISGLKTHRLTRMTTCGQFKLNARPVGPRVRVIKGNVIFEPQPKINPYYRRDPDNCDENTEKNGDFQGSVQNQENLIDHVKIEPISVAGES